MRMFIVATVALAIAGNAASAQQKAPAESVAFAKKVASANDFAIKSSELAQGRAASSEVKSFAKQMIEDHTKLEEDYRSAMQAASISLPAAVQPGAKPRAVLSKLQRAQGPAFDKAYLTAQLAGHKEAVSVLRRYSKLGRTPQIKEFAQKTLPVVEQHLAKALELSNQPVAAGRAPTGTGSRAISPPAESAPRQRGR
jgi:putative membrane protein